MSAGRRFGLLAAVIVVAVVAFVIAKSGGGNDNNSSTSASAAPVRIVVANGKPVGGVKKIKLHKDDSVRFTVKSDVGDEIHVHGYDFHKEVPAGGTVAFSFPAKIEGGFVIELEKRSEQIADLEVQP